MAHMRYRLALDLGSTSLGWAMLRLDAEQAPCAVIKAGVRIFPDGRNPKDGSSLAVTRREARAMRRRRDRLLRRKARLMQSLVELGFFPADLAARKALEQLNPYALRAKGLDEALKPEEFGRALFHINQRRGFLSNRKTDKKDNDTGALKTAVNAMRAALDPAGAEGKARTVGELLYRRLTDSSKPPQLRTVRARYRQARVEKEGGGTRIDKSYDLYVERAMILAEFEALWAKQAQMNPAVFTPTAREQLHYRLTHQRPLKPVRPGRCTLLPDEERALLALPSQQRFRIYQEVNNLRMLGENLHEAPLSLEQRDTLARALEMGNKTFNSAIPKLLGVSGTTKFNLEDAKRPELKGNLTSMILSKKAHFGDEWHRFDEALQDEIVTRLAQEESLEALVRWLQAKTGVDEQRAEVIASVSLPAGFGSLSAKALALILPELRKAVVSYADAAKTAGFHHSRLSDNAPVPGRTFELERIDPHTGEVKVFHVFGELPYYGEFLQRHVGFADPRATPQDLPEKRFGRIANPTVHIGLNQVRRVVNAVIARYGHPAEVIVEVARDLKQSQEQRREDQERQAQNQRRNDRLRRLAAELRGCAQELVKHADVQRLILWEELSRDAAFRRCPYSGAQISGDMVLGNEVEVEHILPFSRTLDDSLNNKTLALRKANRVKRNRTPWEAKDDFAAQGWDYAAMLARANEMPRGKAFRFGEDGLQKWLKGGDDAEGKGFLARALNDTRYMSRVAREYLSLVCPQNTRVIPGQMTAMLRAKFGLNQVLGLNGEKNRNDHRHHAVDACVIAVTDQGLLQRFASASADARERQLNRLVDDMPLPWPTYPDQVRRAVEHILVSHKPDHGHEGELFDATIYGLRGPGKATYRQEVDGAMARPLLNREVVAFADGKAIGIDGPRHGNQADGSPKPYMGLWSRSNYCIEVERGEDGTWLPHVLERYRAYQLVAKHTSAILRNRLLSTRGQPLVMRLHIGDTVRAEIDNVLLLLRVLKINSTGAVTFVLHNETNISGRYAAKLAAQKDAKAGRRFDPVALEDEFFQRSISPESLRQMKARQVYVSRIGELRDPGFGG